MVKNGVGLQDNIIILLVCVTFQFGLVREMYTVILGVIQNVNTAL